MPYDSIATTKLYQEPDFEAYHKAKNVFLAKKLPGYADLSKAELEAKPEQAKAIQREKWPLLLDAFKDVPEDLQEKLQAYKTLILNTEAYAYITQELSLEQQLGFFEEFYFLAYNDEPLYQLDKTKQADLLNSLGQGIGYGSICPTGRGEHFQDIVKRFRVDPSSWVSVELYKQRAAVIYILAQGYDSNTHIHHALSKAARDAGYGIEARAAKDYASTKINAYFKAQAPAKFFVEYEQKAIDHLTNHAMTLVIAWLEKKKGKDLVTAWQKGEKSISFDTTDHTLQKESKQESKRERQDECSIFSRFIQQTLGENLHCLGSLNETYTEFSLKKPADFQRGVRRLIEIKLLQEGFFRPITSVNKDNIQNCVFRLLPEAKPEDLLASIEKIRNIKTSQTDTLLTKEVMCIIQTCPALLTSQIGEEPAVWRRLPKSLQDAPIFIEALIATLGENLSAEKPPDNQDEQLKLLHSLIKKSPHYIKQLPAELFTKEHIVIQFFGMDTESALTRYQELKGKLPLKLAKEAPGEFYFDLYKLLDINKLVTTPFLSTAQLSALAQSLSPQELYDIHLARVDKKLPPLPNFNRTLCIDFMRHFDRGVWRQKGYAYIRQESASLLWNHQAEYLTPKFRKNLARKSVAESENWFLAFLRYQQEIPIFDKAFRSLSDFGTQLQYTAKTIWGMIHSLLVFSYKLLGLFIPPAIGYLLHPYLSSFLAPIVAYMDSLFIFYFGPVLPYVVLIVLALLFLHCINNIFPHWGFGLVLKMLCVLFTLLDPMFIVTLWMHVVFFFITATLLLPIFTWPEAFLWAFRAHTFIVVYWVGAILNGIAAIKLTAEEIQTLLTLLWNAIAPWFSRGWLTLTAAVEQAPTKDEVLKIAIEDSILRLTMMDEPTALQKASILLALWEKIKTDPTKDTLQQKLQKHYPLSEKEEKGESLSFQEVAATKRIPGQDFEPKMQDKRCTFFGLRSKRNTTTMDTLNACMQLRLS